MRKCFLLDIDGTTLFTPKVITDYVDKTLLEEDPFENIMCFKKYEDFVQFYSAYIDLCIENKNYICPFVKKTFDSDLFLITRFKCKRTLSITKLAELIKAKDFFEFSSYSNYDSKFRFTIDIVNMLCSKYGYDTISYYDDEASNIFHVISTKTKCNIMYNLIVYPYLENERASSNGLILSNTTIEFITHHEWFNGNKEI